MEENKFLYIRCYVQVHINDVHGCFQKTEIYIYVAHIYWAKIDWFFSKNNFLHAECCYISLYLSRLFYK